MSKDRAIPCALHICASFLVPYSNAVSTSCSDRQIIYFFPLSDFPAKDSGIRPQLFYTFEWPDVFDSCLCTFAILLNEATSRVWHFIETHDEMLRCNKMKSSHAPRFYNKWNMVCAWMSYNLQSKLFGAPSIDTLWNFLSKAI